MIDRLNHDKCLNINSCQTLTRQTQTHMSVTHLNQQWKRKRNTPTLSLRGCDKDGKVIKVRMLIPQRNQPKENLRQTQNSDTRIPSFFFLRTKSWSVVKRPEK